REINLDLGQVVGLLALELGDRFADEAYVEVEADGRDVTGLLAAEQVAGAADLEVLHRDLCTGAEVAVLRDRREPVVGFLGQRLLGWVEEVGIGAVATAPDATAQLMQLGQTEQVAAFDDEG